MVERPRRLVSASAARAVGLHALLLLYARHIKKGGSASARWEGYRRVRERLRELLLDLPLSFDRISSLERFLDDDADATGRPSGYDNSDTLAIVLVGKVDGSVRTGLLNQDRIKLGRLEGFAGGAATC